MYKSIYLLEWQCYYISGISIIWGGISLIKFIFGSQHEKNKRYYLFVIFISVNFV